MVSFQSLGIFLNLDQCLIVTIISFWHEFRKRGKNGNKKRGKGKKKNFKKRKTKQEPRLVNDMNSCLLNDICLICMTHTHSQRTVQIIVHNLQQMFLHHSRCSQTEQVFDDHITHASFIVHNTCKTMHHHFKNNCTLTNHQSRSQNLWYPCPVERLDKGNKGSGNEIN